MSKGISFGLVAVGIALLVWGFDASESFGSDMHRLFSGGPTDRSIWLLVGGIAAVTIGGFGLLRGGRGA